MYLFSYDVIQSKGSVFRYSQKLWFTNLSNLSGRWRPRIAINILIYNDTAERLQKITARFLKYFTSQFLQSVVTQVSGECLVFSKIAAHTHKIATVVMNYDNFFCEPYHLPYFCSPSRFPVSCHYKRIYMYKPCAGINQTYLH